MLATKRRKFLSLEDAYHGNTIGALSIGSADRDTYPNLLESCDHIAPPLDEGALDRLETRLKRRDVAAFVMEPISINLGVLVPSKEFMTGVQRLCRRYGTLLVMDEVACGFGRTGTLFATEQFDIEPDIVCVGKAVTGGGLGLGAMIATAKVARAMEEGGSFWSTYGWHPRSTAVAIAVIRYMTANRATLMSGVRSMGARFEKRLYASQLADTSEAAAVAGAHHSGCRGRQRSRHPRAILISSAPPVDRRRRGPRTALRPPGSGLPIPADRETDVRRA